MKAFNYIITLCILFFNCALYAQLDLDFETDRGLYDTPFDLELTVDDPSATIRYTTNGTAPTPTTGTIYTTTIPINSTSTIRAIAYTNTESTKVLTHTYIFPNDIISQSYMSNHIKNNSTWSSQLEASLLSIPSISLVIPAGSEITEESRVDASVEFLFPNENMAIQNDTEAKYFGRASLNSGKKNIRIYFDSIHGGNLEYPLLEGFDFGIPVTSEFDQIDLRGDAHESFLSNSRTYVGPRFGDITTVSYTHLTLPTICSV